MKLRFRGNALRLRVNRQEVDQLASGLPLQESVEFPGNRQLTYVLEAASANPEASFEDAVIRVGAPQNQVRSWAQSDEIGMYFDLTAGHGTLTVAIEKDLECVDGPPDEKDPYAFPRSTPAGC